MPGDNANDQKSENQQFMGKYKSRGTLCYEICECGKSKAYFAPDDDHHAKHDESEFAVFISCEDKMSIALMLTNKSIKITFNENKEEFESYIFNAAKNRILVEIIVKCANNSTLTLVGIKVPAK